MSELADIQRKVERSQRLTLADGLALFACRDLHELGRLADQVRRRRHGASTYYNVNCHINYTNVCTLRCGVCGYARQEGEPGAYELGIDDIVARAAHAAAAGASEVHMTGGLHPRWRLDHYEQMVSAIRAAAPDLHIKAFTAVELDHIAAVSGVSVEVVLARLIQTGLGSLPGGGAEIFDPQVRGELFPRKITGERWLEIHRLAHRLGLRSNATMLYGHVETPRHRVEHLLALRELQDQSGGLQAIVPLAFVPPPPQAGLPVVAQAPTALDDLRTVAVARLLLDNVDHVKTFWIMHGLKLSQLALHYGADDIDGTVTQYRIVDGADGEAVTVEHLRKLVAEAGFVPVERDSLYRPLS